MKRFTSIMGALVFLALISSCKEIGTLEEIKIHEKGNESNSTVIGCSVNTGYLQLAVTGYYSDDSDEDLTNSVTWSSDTTDTTTDISLSNQIPGLVYCSGSATGEIMGVKAVYELNTSETGSTSSASAATTDFVDTAIVKTK